MRGSAGRSVMLVLLGLNALGAVAFTMPAAQKKDVVYFLNPDGSYRGKGTADHPLLKRWQPVGMHRGVERHLV